MIANCLRLLLASAIAMVSFTAAADDPMRVQSGLLSGVSGRNDVRIFKGVPYAAPPVADLRWRPPAPPTPWSGVRTADHFGPDCPQYEIHSNPVFTKGNVVRGDEDCLYLNVWTAAKTSKERRPVMVWIHGGGFNWGSGSLPQYDGEALAQKGVVLVTLNYRLNVFGFLAHPELSRESPHHVSGNYGALDQLAALRWVRENIAAFGGDPNKVTIFGESSGAASVGRLMASPLAKDLFVRAIAESDHTAWLRSKRLSQVEKEGADFTSNLGARSMADLRTMPIEKLMTAYSPLVTIDALMKVGPFGPIIDGYFMPAHIHEVFNQGHQAHVPLLLGLNSEDSGYGTIPAIARGAFLKAANDKYGALAGDFLKLYPAGSDEEADHSHRSSWRDEMAAGVRRWARLQVTTGQAPVYLYWFDRAPPGPQSAKIGAYHSAEIPYVFDSLDRVDRPWNEEDRKLADLMSSYWVNFAASGDPNGRGLPHWAAYDPKTDLSMELGTTRLGPRSWPALDARRLDLQDRINTAERRK
jgi:para-nitrobenzyl esterase